MRIQGNPVVMALWDKLVHMGPLDAAEHWVQQDVGLGLMVGAQPPVLQAVVAVAAVAVTGRD